MVSDCHARRLARARKALALLGLLILLAFVIAVIRHGRDIAALAAFGYPGVAILMFLSSSTVLFPAPGFAAVLAAGVLWNPLLVGVAAGLGAATGELTGYLLGVGGGAMLHLQEDGRWKRAHRWLSEHGMLGLLLLAAIPNPLFDVLGLVAGSLSYPVRRFWIACLVGNSIKYAALAYLANRVTGWTGW